ncbi:hypothetical protein MANES_10G101288v8 [Manihot esculenta]|uniref:Uncharacterized protein n=1 Tax=Manihot esculenta TaxID=3983 RepID=A0A2C9V4Z9_MANES|nr:hypothetical protein MANES_10G101288v8 [Manihot esculenta]
MASSHFVIFVILLTLSFSCIGVATAGRRLQQLFANFPPLDLPPLPKTPNDFPVPPVVKLPPGLLPSRLPYSFFPFPPAAP